MTKTRRILALAASLLIAGCASWQTPSPEALGNLRCEVRRPQTCRSRLRSFLSVRHAIATTVSIKGSIFAKEAEQSLNVTLHRGIYKLQELDELRPRDVAGQPQGPQGLRGGPAPQLRPSGTGLGEDPPR